MVEPVALWLVAMHLIGDFPLQPDWMAKKKAWLHSPGERPEGFVSLVLHVGVHGFLFVPIAYYTLAGPAIAVFIAWIVVSHGIIDSRRWVKPKDGWGNDGRVWVWLNDQIMHFAALGLAYPITYAVV